MKTFIKILIYFAAILIIAIIQASAKQAGIILGFIPTMLLYAIFIGGATFIVKKIK